MRRSMAWAPPAASRAPKSLGRAAEPVCCACWVRPALAAHPALGAEGVVGAWLAGPCPGTSSCQPTLMAPGFVASVGYRATFAATSASIDTPRRLASFDSESPDATVTPDGAAGDWRSEGDCVRLETVDGMAGVLSMRTLQEYSPT